jgi:hypothetical protein
MYFAWCKLHLNYKRKHRYKKVNVASIWRTTGVYVLRGFIPSPTCAWAAVPLPAAGDTGALSGDTHALTVRQGSMHSLLEWGSWEAGESEANDGKKVTFFEQQSNWMPSVLLYGVCWTWTTIREKDPSCMAPGCLTSTEMSSSHYLTWRTLHDGSFLEENFKEVKVRSQIQFWSLSCKSEGRSRILVYLSS